jgi:Plasmid pRiA4b ORF-3-like protein
MATPKKIPFTPAPGERCLYQIKMTLKWSDPKIWRRIFVASNIDLYAFNIAIQIAMGWEDAHLHQFIMDKVYYEPKPDDDMDDFRSPWGPRREYYDDMVLSDLLSSPKDKMDYEYDLGDGWIHNLVLEKILPWDDEIAIPKCIAGEMNCPPEDCGGIPGYYNMLEILGNKKHPEHKDMKEWIGGKFDPTEFDVELINAYFKSAWKEGVDPGLN